MEQLILTYARVREDLLREGLHPPCSHSIDDMLWDTQKFEVLTLMDESEDFNMIILHPLTGERLQVYSIDFDYS